jgi:hypothetical protein
MRWSRKSLLPCLWSLLAALSLGAADFKLIDGTTLSGDLVAADKDGFVIKLEGGAYSSKTDWGKLADESLLEMSKQPKARKFVEPYVIQPDETVTRTAPRELQLTAPARVSRPEVKKGVANALFSPGGLFFLGLVYLANLFFAFEVARFKWRKPVLVCGLAAVAPIVGPLIFLVMPKWQPPEEIDATAEAMQNTTLTVQDSGPSMVSQMGLRAGSGGPAAPSSDLPRSFGRGEFTFNRRFFETQFADFLPTANEQAAAGLVMDFQTQHGHVLGNRINRMNASEVIVRVPGGDEAPVDYGQILQVTLRKADA